MLQRHSGYCTGPTSHLSICYARTHAHMLRNEGYKGGYVKVIQEGDTEGRTTLLGGQNVFKTCSAVARNDKIVRWPACSPDINPK